MLVAACLTFLTLLAVFALAPVRISLSVQGRGEPDGTWALAAGTQLGPVAVTGLAARGVPAMARAHLFGREIWKRPLAELVGSKADGEDGRQDAIGAWRGRYGRLQRWLDPAATARFVVGEHRRVALESLVADFDYSFRDVALTGRIMAALYAVAGMCPPKVVIRQKVSWKAEDRGTVALSTTVKLWPGRMALDAVVFLVKNVRLLPVKGRRIRKVGGEGDEREEDR